MHFVGGNMKLITKMRILRVLRSVMILAVLLISYAIGYHNGFVARGPVVHFGRDVRDITFVEAKRSTGTYDPYFTHVNTIPSKTR
jgi:hypothetical protein